MSEVKLPAALSEIKEIVANVCVREDSAVFASLTTLDGRSLTFYSTKEGIHEQKIAAMSSSILSMTEAFGREVLGGKCSYSAISTNLGSIVTVRIPTTPSQYALSYCADRSENMATVLRTTLDTAEGLVGFLDQKGPGEV